MQSWATHVEMSTALSTPVENYTDVTIYYREGIES